MARITIAEARRLGKALPASVREVITTARTALNWRQPYLIGNLRLSPEHQIHVAIVKELKLRLCHGALLYHAPNEAVRSKVMWALLYALGLVKGAPDIFIFCSEMVFFIEVKQPKKKLSPEQEHWRNWALDNGFPYCTATSVEEALVFCSDNYLLR